MFYYNYAKYREPSCHNVDANATPNATLGVSNGKTVFTSLNTLIYGIKGLNRSTELTINGLPE